MRLGRYETLRPIASGGMATVHLARAHGAGGFERLVAIKALHPHIASEPEFVAMFLDEARLAASIRHPNVVATIDVQEDPLFLVMDYVEGPSLHLVQRELKKRGERVPLEITLRVLVDVLAGLHAAHELRAADGTTLELIHRDVSPQNILLGLDGITRITDFGVARAASRLSSTRGGQVKGKIKYMAPEQVASEELDRGVDIYAAGIVLWEMFTNQHLYQGDSDAAVLAQILRGPSRPLRDLVPGLPEAIEAVCMRALEGRREARYRTAADFVDALEGAARASGVAVASGRAVTAFVKHLDLHEVAPATGALPPEPSSPGSSSVARAAARAVAVAAAPDPQSSTNVGTLLASPPEPGSNRKVRGVVMAVLALGVLSALGLAARGLGPSGSGTVAGSAGAAEPAVPAGVPTVVAVPSAAAASAVRPEATAEPSSAPSDAVASSTATPLAASAGAPLKTTGTPKPRPTAFRPGGL